MEASDQTTSWRWTGAALAVLVACNLLAFGQVTGFEFVTLDDTKLIATNPLVTDWWHAPLKDRLLTSQFAYAIPVTVATWAMDHALFRGSPAGFHLMNLALHGLCAVFVFFIARRLTSTLPAFAGAMVFLLHPVQAEAVSFITQRKDLLACLFSLLALERLLASSEHPDRRRPWSVGTSVAAIGLACLSKPSALAMGPALGLMVLGDRERFHSVERPRLLAELFILLAVVLGVVNLYVHSLSPTSISLGQISLGDRLFFVGHTLFHYVSSIFFPWSLSAKVPRPEPSDPLWPALISLGTLCLFVLLYIYVVRKKMHRASLILCWCAGAYLMIANLVPLKRYTADSFLYLLMTGIAFAAATGLDTTARRWPGPSRNILATITVLLALGLGVLAHGQSSVWRDEEALFSYLYRKHPEYSEAATQYAEHLVRVGRPIQARTIMVDFLSRVIRSRPGSMAARHHLMRLHLESGNVEAARAVLLDAPHSLEGQTSYWEAWLELAMRRNDLALALRSARTIVRLDPSSPRKVLLEQLEKTASAIR